MRKNSKKALYESIMRNVAKEVKKALNESEIDLNQWIDNPDESLFTTVPDYTHDTVGILVDYIPYNENYDDDYDINDDEQSVFIPISTFNINTDNTDDIFDEIDSYVYADLEDQIGPTENIHWEYVESKL